MAIPVRSGSRRSCRETLCTGIVAVGALLLISSCAAAPTDGRTSQLLGPGPIEQLLMPYPEMPYLAVRPVPLASLYGVKWLDAYVYQPLPAESSWDLQEPEKLDVYQDFLGFSGIGTPGGDPHRQVAPPAPGAAGASTAALMDRILKMTAIAFLITVIMVPAGCAFVAQILYVNPRDGSQRLNVRAGPVAGAMAYPSLSSCL